MTPRCESFRSAAVGSDRRCPPTNSRAASQLAAAASKEPPAPRSCLYLPCLSCCFRCHASYCMGPKAARGREPWGSTSARPMAALLVYDWWGESRNVTQYSTRENVKNEPIKTSHNQNLVRTTQPPRSSRRQSQWPIPQKLVRRVGSVTRKPTGAVPEHGQPGRRQAVTQQDHLSRLFVLPFSRFHA